MAFPFRSLAFVLPAAAAAVAVPVAPALAADPAQAPVQALSDGLIAIMKAGKASGHAGRAARIAPVVDRAFDLPLMTRLAVGPAWAKASPGDRAALLAAFRRLTINEYAKNFDSWSGQSITVDPQVEARATDRVVRTTLTAPREAPVSIAYRLRQTGGEWRIIDVFFKNAISQLTTRRADFDAIVQRGGAAALVGHVNALADKAAR